MNSIKRGTIWYVKSCNEYEEYYEGMTFGTSLILVTAFYNYNTDNKITYFKIDHRKSQYSLEIEINNITKYIHLDKLYTGDAKCLDYYVKQLEFTTFRKLLTIASKISRKQAVNSQKNIEKFGITVYITENEDVKLTKSNKIKLSKRAKEDIIYNSKTDEDIKILCEKYNIYPIKAIKEIRNRLIYQHKQNEG